MVRKALLACTFLVATANCSNSTLGWGDDECYDLESEIVLYEPGKVFRRTVHEVNIPPYGGWYRNQILCILISLISFLITTGYCLSYPQRQDYSQRQVDSKYPKDYATSKIVKHENNLGLTNYNFSYETSDGSQREETAELKNAGSENESLAVQGSYTYVGTDGLTYKVTYVADENGYRASGQHLPKTG
ncbi:unnamed protein product [Callosobruchus maculatus]|uniref:Uncharacterized protein n=1 Tax=Callosobruchus maculatus TaxID=64391 RepID=A0A653D688_CALMS|nr:unnamed protein product [Callosobruchus maculatus]